MTKQDLIKILSDTPDKYLSGDFLAKTFGVSRNTIWKHINSLKSEGFTIDAVKNRGYKLSGQDDVLNSELIIKHLDEPSLFKIECYDVLSSTNTIVKDRSLENEGLVVIANSQEMGVGRLGRNFFSPKNTGIYFSLLLKPTFSNEKTHFITSMAGIAVCRAINKLLGLSPKIKWVNDIYLEDKKVCGILTQGSFSLENNAPEYIVLGIGVNVYTPTEGFPKDIENIASGLLVQQQGNLRNKLVATIINEFWVLYNNPNFSDIAIQYKALSFVLGREVTILSAQSTITAKVIDIDDECRLVVELEDGKIKKISSGEIIRSTLT